MKMACIAYYNAGVAIVNSKVVGLAAELTLPIIGHVDNWLNLTK
jgi:hypothetical protein